MKKIFLSIFMLVFGIAVFAQDVVEETSNTGTLVSKKGEAYLPESGDWAISFDASPIFYYVGNAFNGNLGNNTSPGVKFLNYDYTIVGKLFLDDKTAIRGLVRLGFGNEKDNAFITQATAGATTYPALIPTVEDSHAHKYTAIAIGGGYEMRRGKTRLQGYYGGDLMIWMSSYTDKYTYGNALSATYTDPQTISANFGDNYATDSYGNNARVLEYKSGTTFGFGVRGFIGVEYFLFPKIAVGAEYGWGIGFQKTGEGSEKIESYGGAAPGSIGTQTQKWAGSSEFGADTDVNQDNVFGASGSNTGSATVRVTFHF